MLNDNYNVRVESSGLSEAVVHGRSDDGVRARGTVEDMRLVFSRVHVGGGARFWARERWGETDGSDDVAGRPRPPTLKPDFLSAMLALCLNTQLLMRTCTSARARYAGLP